MLKKESSVLIFYNSKEMFSLYVASQGYQCSHFSVLKSFYQLFLNRLFSSRTLSDFQLKRFFVSIDSDNAFKSRLVYLNLNCKKHIIFKKNNQT